MSLTKAATTSIRSLNIELLDSDKEFLLKLKELYFLSQIKFQESNDTSGLIESSNLIGRQIQEFMEQMPCFRVYGFSTPHEMHAECSRLISKLRDVNTEHYEFVYYIQRAHELLFNFAFRAQDTSLKQYFAVKTPVNAPFQNVAIHKYDNLDDQINNTVMVVLLRGALLPSMIISKEIQEYSSTKYTTPFALFKVKRDDTKTHADMEYEINLERSYFDSGSLKDKTLIIADPMLATGGSAIAVLQYLKSQNIALKSIKFLHVIASLEGVLRLTRFCEKQQVDFEICTLWLDPAMNESAYILPGLGDAGDRLNGKDEQFDQRNLLRLMVDAGDIMKLYRNQLKEIEKVVF